MQLIRLPEVTRRTGLARSTVYKYTAEGTFPGPVSLGGRCSAWVLAEVEEWIGQRIEERNAAGEVRHGG